MDTRRRRWMFTWNNYPEGSCPKDWGGYKYICYQGEVGLEGTPHIQGYVWWSDSRSFRQLKDTNPGIPQISWKYCTKSHEKNVKYCTKEDTRAWPPVIEGTPPQQGKRSDLEEVVEDIEGGCTLGEIIKMYPIQFMKYHSGISKMLQYNGVKRQWKTVVIVLTGAPDTGKSRWCNDNFPNAYWKTPGNDWWDGYTREDIVIIDDYYGFIPYTNFLQLCDRYPLDVAVKGSHTPFLAKLLLITSNKPYYEWYKASIMGTVDKPYEDDDGTDIGMTHKNQNAIGRRLSGIWHFESTDNVIVRYGLTMSETKLRFGSLPDPTVGDDSIVDNSQISTSLINSDGGEE